MQQERFEIDGHWLSKRPNTKNWYATWYCRKTGQTRRSSLGTADFELAKKGLAHYVIKHAELKNIDSQDMPLPTVFIRYFNRHGSEIRSHDIAKRSLNIWLDFWQESCVSELTRPEQNNFISYLKDKGYSPGYIRRIITVGKAALNHCVEYGELTHSPKIIMPKEPGGKRENRLTVSQARALFDTATEKQLPHIYDYLIFAFNTAARPEAIFDLTYDQVDLKNNQINLNPKGRIQTKKYRPIVPITNNLRKWLESRQFTRTDALVSYNGKPVKSIKKAFRGVRDAAGLPQWVCPYIIRHTVAQHLRDEGVAFENIQGLLGHSIKGCTSIYASFNPNKQHQIIETIDRLMEDILVRD